MGALVVPFGSYGHTPTPESLVVNIWLDFLGTYYSEGKVKLKYRVEDCHGPYVLPNYNLSTGCFAMCLGVENSAGSPNPHDFVKCLIWVSLASIWISLPDSVVYGYGELENWGTVRDDSQRLLEEFLPYGLDYRNCRQLFQVQNVLSEMFLRIVRTVTEMASDKTMDTVLCSSQRIYDMTRTSLYGFAPCLNLICSTRQLSPDLGGIGVSSLEEHCELL